MRTFVAIDLPEKLLSRLKDIQDSLSRQGKWRGVHWVRPGSIHLTIKFLGEVEERRLGEIEQALGAAGAGIVPFTVRACGVGAFPSLKGPRVVWAGIEAAAGLLRLQKNMDEKLAALGFETEARDFHPHLTLCRVKAPSEGRELGRIIAQAPPMLDESWEASSFALYKSVLSPAGAQYSVLKRIDLKG